MMTEVSAMVVPPVLFVFVMQHVTGMNVDWEKHREEYKETVKITVTYFCFVVMLLSLCAMFSSMLLMASILPMLVAMSPHILWRTIIGVVVLATLFQSRKCWPWLMHSSLSCEDCAAWISKPITEGISSKCLSINQRLAARTPAPWTIMELSSRP
jgi:hypothetical protein